MMKEEAGSLLLTINKRRVFNMDEQPLGKETEAGLIDIGSIVAKRSIFITIKKFALTAAIVCGAIPLFLKLDGAHG